MITGTHVAFMGNGPETYYSPWFPKMADNAYFTYEIMRFNWGTGGGMTVTVYTKNREDFGSEGTSYTGFVPFGTGDFYHLDCTNLKELVRFKITFDQGEDPDLPAGVCYRFLRPTWYATAR